MAARAGTFERQASVFRDRVGSVDPGRYHLYISWACPWAHRTAIGRVLMGLEDAIGLTAVDPIRDERGWRFTGGEYTDPLPAALAERIDRVEQDPYDGLNNAVYRAGFATTQAAYEDDARRVFATLDVIEHRLTGSRYLMGDRITEVDWRAFTTLVRFDSVYYSHFKCNVRRIVDYPALWGYTRDLYQQPGIAETVRMDEIKAHYYGTHPSINPTGIVPIGPELDFSAPHDRG
jgi:glutathionyl-hydroquinone reductase